MKLRPNQSTALVSTLFASALAIAAPAWARQPASQKPAPRTYVSKSRAAASHSAKAAHSADGTEAALAAAGAAGAVGLIAGGGSHSAQGGNAAGQDAPTVLSAPAASAVQAATTAITTFNVNHVDQNRVRSYTTFQPPALVVTAAMHRRMTTTSADIPTPYPSAIALLQVRRVDRIINQTAPDVAQEILPAHAVDRGIGFIPPGNSPTGTPEPAPGIILLGGVLGVGALILARKQRLTTL